MSAATVAAIRALIDEHPELLPILDEHLKDNEGEVLPHLVMADVVRWLVRNEEAGRDDCRAVLAWMERRFLTGSEEVRGLIAVSGVGMLPDPGNPGAGLRDLLGPSLREVDPWQ